MKIRFQGCLIIALLPLLLTGQISVTGAFSSDTVQIGSPVELTLSILKQEGVEIKAVYSNFIDSVYSAYQTLQNRTSDTSELVPVRADYEILDYGLWKSNDDQPIFGPVQLNWDQSESGTGILIENKFKVRLWDPGENFTFLPPVLYVMDGEDQQFYEGGIVRTFVAAPPGMEQLTQDSLDLAPIKPIITEKRNFTDYLGFVYGLVALVLVAGLYLVFNRITKEKEKIVEGPIQIIEPPHVIALDALQKLKEERLWQAGEIKTYQSRLTYIIREYIENRFGIHALERTTDYIVSQVRNEGILPSLVTKLSRVLRIADLVKFAKAKPDIDLHDQFMDEAIQFVKQTTEITSENEDGPLDDGQDLGLLNQNETS